MMVVVRENLAPHFVERGGRRLKLTRTGPCWQGLWALSGPRSPRAPKRRSIFGRALSTSLATDSIMLYGDCLNVVRATNLPWAQQVRAKSLYAGLLRRTNLYDEDLKVIDHLKVKAHQDRMQAPDHERRKVDANSLADKFAKKARVQCHPLHSEVEATGKQKNTKTLQTRCPSKIKSKNLEKQPITTNTEGNHLPEAQFSKFGSPKPRPARGTQLAFGQTALKSVQKAYYA